MYGREKRVLLREYLEHGWSKTALAAKLGLSRRTVYHWIETGQLDRDADDEAARYKARPVVAHKLDAFRGIIEARLQAYPLLSSVRLLEEVKAAGYVGGYTQLKEYVRQVRPVVEDPVVRFETPPGHQAQVDFAHFRLPWGRRWALLVVLGYSRLLWLRFFRRQDMSTLLAGLEQSFAFFEGVARELLFDQMKSVIVEDQRLNGGRLVENPEFIRFANHWQFTARACRAYRAQTKGKVERPIRYVRENFFYGRTFLNDEDLNCQAEQWLQRVANVRVHGTTAEVPQERFQRDERMTLTALAARPYRSLVLSAATLPRLRAVASGQLQVERRPLQVYTRIVGGRP
ncbi:MAG: IS21 family transposase [Candidatus Eisenbacteria bacterium]|jgi:transposase|nr:IS21 family transposase [Candidatus Eisenbacteria bacterium]